MSKLDVITYELIAARLSGIVREMENAVFRTGYSTIVRESHDFSCGLLDQGGRLISRGSHPGHMGGLPVSIEGLLNFYPLSDMKPGDSFLASHPYHCGCPHANDMVVMAPIFADDALMGFAASIGHTPDVGGVAAGSRNASARDLFGEGLQIMPVRFTQDYTLVKDTATFVRANSRVPDQMIGDLMAKAGVCHGIGESRMRDLASVYGSESIVEWYEEAGARTALRAKDQIALWPDGVHEVETWVDNPGGEEPIRLHVLSIKEGDQVVLDFTGTGNQTPAPINVRPSFITGLAQNAVIRVSDRDIPLNYGMAEAIQTRFRKGSLIDPEFPGPVGFYSKTLALVESAIGSIIAKASGNRPIAHIATQSSIVVGYPKPNGKESVQYELMYAGAPAFEGADGFTGVGSRASFAKMTSVEIIETEFPVQMTEFEVIPDSGGDGRFRGGPGYTREYKVNGRARLSGGASRREASGVEGGSDGRNAYVIVNPGSDDEQCYPGIVSNVGLEPGDVFRIETGGGGGVYDLAGRDGDSIAGDIQDGVITAEHAATRYSLPLESAHQIQDS